MIRMIVMRLALQNVDPGAKNGPPEKKNGSHGSHEAGASKRAPRASQGRKRCLAVNFQEVVHSARTGNSEVAKPQRFAENRMDNLLKVHS